MNRLFYSLIASLFILTSCQNESAPDTIVHKELKNEVDSTKDWHTQSNYTKVNFKHLSLDITVDFDEKIIAGSATWYLDSTVQNAKRLFLDTRNLEIDSVLFKNGDKAEFQLENPVPFLGSALRIELKDNENQVTIFYKTKKDATALQWLTPAQTFGKKAPFLYTQSESIYARSWIPCPDGPGIRFTYDAKVKVPTGLLALMSAENPQAKTEDGVYTFKMEQAIPAYLMALAVGDIAFKSIDDRTGVYAEPAILNKAYREFEDVGKMVQTAENIYGPYRWGRYDILVLPSGFPLGGMENPHLTFCTPTILAGDKSLVNLIAHELAHSWSGNLVTNATWNDFWLNEGFTVYFERRITEATYDKDYVDMLWELGYQDLESTVADMGKDDKDTWLRLYLKDRDPDIGLTDVAYEKGAAFLHLIELTVGRADFDKFLNQYFSSHAFQTISTAQFLDYLNKNLLDGHDDWKKAINVNEWVYGPGIPKNCPQPGRVRFTKVEEQIKSFENGATAKSLQTKGWSTYEWMHFLRKLSTPIALDKMKDLETVFKFTKTENNEIADIWYLQALKSNYTEAYPSIKHFLINIGREKFLEPLYKELMRTPEGEVMAKSIYKEAKQNYHPLAQKDVEHILFPEKIKVN